MDGVIVAATVVIACSAIVSAWLTWRLSQDNRALRKAGTEPEVVAYLGLDERSPSTVNLVLENIGQGPAFDVEFLVDASPEDFAEHQVSHVVAGTRRKIASLLPQGGRIERRMAAGFHLIKEDEHATLRPFWVEVSYENVQGMRVGPKVYELDVSEFGGSLAGWPADERAAEALERSEKHLGQLARSVTHWRLEALAGQKAVQDENNSTEDESGTDTATDEEAVADVEG